MLIISYSNYMGLIVGLFFAIWLYVGPYEVIMWQKKFCSFLGLYSEDQIVLCRFLTYANSYCFFVLLCLVLLNVGGLKLVI